MKIKVLGFAALLSVGVFGQSTLTPLLGLPRASSRLIAAHESPRAQLGKKLFFDPRLSADGAISCASCHKPESAFSDGQKVAKGLREQPGTRNTPSLLNAALAPVLMWDGRHKSPEEQALEPFTNPLEHGLGSLEELLAKLHNDPKYVRVFREAFPQDSSVITSSQVAQALGAYVRTLAVADSPFDGFYFAGQQDALSPAARRGLALFQGRAQCAECHSIGKEGALFSDYQFHSVGVGLERVQAKLPELTRKVIALRQEGKPLDHLMLNDPELAELGRFLVTLEPKDIGKFRTPSLRNVALTAPYMHDGSIPTLEEAVESEIYYRGLAANRPLILTPEEKNDLVEFLRALNSNPQTIR